MITSGGVLATGRTDGSPQQAMVGYTLDNDRRLLISTRVTSAKWLNVVLGGDRPEPSAITAWLDQDKRGIIRITSHKALFHTS